MLVRRQYMIDVISWF